MKYFTAELWAAFNSTRRESAFKLYDRRLQSYMKQLQAVIPRLNPHARPFFREACLLHDCTLARLEVGDHIDHPDQWLSRDKINRRRASVRLTVLTEDAKNIYTLRYVDVTRVEVNFPGEKILFPVGRYSNFGDWGYDELTVTRTGQFRHDVLFASGSTIMIEFEKFAFRKKLAKSA